MDFIKQIERHVAEADKLVESRRYDEARLIYEQIAVFFRNMREAQRREVPGQTIPLSLRLMVVNRDLIVPLDRLGELHTTLGNFHDAARYFYEVVEAMEEAVRHAGGETITEFEALLVTARRKLAEAESKRGPVASRAGDLAQYDARYRRAMEKIAVLDRLLGESTLLLARRILQRSLESLTDADVRFAIVQINELPNFTKPLTDREIDGLVAAESARIRSLATELADVYRDHPGLV